MSIILKYGSIALVRPDGSKIEAKLLDDASRPRNYSIEALSNGDEHVVNIVAPIPGDWYAIAYRSYQDPDDGKIKQQGTLFFFQTIYPNIEFVYLIIFLFRLRSRCKLRYCARR